MYTHICATLGVIITLPVPTNTMVSCVKW